MDVQHVVSNRHRPGAAEEGSQELIARRLGSPAHWEKPDPSIELRGRREAGSQDCHFMTQPRERTAKA